MSNIVDLGLLVKEPIIFRDPTGEEFKIPGEISTKFVLRLSHYQKEVKKIKNEEEALKKAQELVCDILNLDKSKNIDAKYIEENISDIRYIKIIIQKMMEHISEVSKEVNLEQTPES